VSDKISELGLGLGRREVDYVSNVYLRRIIMAERTTSGTKQELVSQ